MGRCGENSRHARVQKRGSPLRATPRLGTGLLVEAAAESILHPSGERSAGPLTALLPWRAWLGARAIAAAIARRGAVIAKITPPNITTNPMTDRIGKLPIMVALNATPETSMARPITKSATP